MSMDNDILEVLLTREQIKEICEKLGAQITKDYEGKKLLLVSVLRGAVVFMADIMREIKLPCEIDFMSIQFPR